MGMWERKLLLNLEEFLDTTELTKNESGQNSRKAPCIEFRRNKTSKMNW